LASSWLDLDMHTRDGVPVIDALALMAQ